MRFDTERLASGRMDPQPVSAPPEQARLGLVFYASCSLAVVFVGFGLLFPALLGDGMLAVRE